MKLPLGYWQGQYRDHMSRVLRHMAEGLADPTLVDEGLSEDFDPSPEQLGEHGIPEGKPLDIPDFKRAFGTALNRATVLRWQDSIRSAESSNALREAFQSMFDDLELLDASTEDRAESAVLRAIAHTANTFAWAARAHEACFRACPYPDRFMKKCPITLFWAAATEFRLMELLRTFQEEGIVGPLPPDIMEGPNLGGPDQ